MAGDKTEQLYCDIEKGLSADEATVCGYVTSGTIDLGKQIVDPDWIKKALPPWTVKWGNVRAQHRADSPVGVVDAASLDMNGGKPYVEMKIVDADALRKLHAGVYKGISIGVKNPIVVADANAAGGRIVGGDIIEISLVDRPSNPDSLITLIKSAGPGEWKDVQTGAVLTPDGVGAGMAAAEKNPPPGSPLAERQRLLAAMAEGGDHAAVADLIKAGAPNHSFGVDSAVEAPHGWMPRSQDELRKMEADAAATAPAASAPAAAAAAATPGAAAEPAAAQPDEAKVASGNHRTSSEKHAHPFDGTHNHAHGHSHPYSGGAVVHQHAHSHADDDVHGSPHDGTSHASDMAMKSADAPANLKDRLVAHLVAFPGVEPIVKPDVVKAVADAVAGVVKAASDFAGGYPAPAATEARPAKLEGAGGAAGLTYGQEPPAAAARIEGLASQTDQDRDGDIDGMAAQDKTGSEQVSGTRDQVATPAITPSRPEALEMTFAAHRDEIIKLVVADATFTKYVSSLVNAAVTAAVSTSEAVTKQASVDHGASVADVAKMAGSIATGLQAIATATVELTSGLEGVRADAAKSADRLDALAKDVQIVKSTAQAEKGVGLGTGFAAVGKGFMLDPVSFQPANAADAATTMERMIGSDPKVFVAKLAAMPEEERMKFAAAMLSNK